MHQLDAFRRSVTLPAILNVKNTSVLDTMLSSASTVTHVRGLGSLDARSLTARVHVSFVLRHTDGELSLFDLTLFARSRTTTISDGIEDDEEIVSVDEDR
mmetsp:Transcript_9806/g.19858  ORF Transcript_9806/g.19858 Transcript_9806/m.19858 type:complete len:100 (+) Transcript_9806:120-419(+)